MDYLRVSNIKLYLFEDASSLNKVIIGCQTWLSLLVVRNRHNVTDRFYLIELYGFRYLCELGYVFQRKCSRVRGISGTHLSGKGVV